MFILYFFDLTRCYDPILPQMRAITVCIQLLDFIEVKMKKMIVTNINKYTK